jgi:hypothetical protein
MSPRCGECGHESGSDALEARCELLTAENAELTRKAALWDRFLSLWEAAEEDMLECVGALVDEEHAASAPRLDPAGPAPGLVGMLRPEPAERACEMLDFVDEGGEAVEIPCGAPALYRDEHGVLRCEDCANAGLEAGYTMTPLEAGERPRTREEFLEGQADYVNDMRKDRGGR